MAAENFSSTYRCPSNIALVKYWGKKAGGIQWPANPSISITLNDLFAETTVSLSGKNTSGKPQFTFLFDHQPKPSFEPKLTQFFDRIWEQLPVVREYAFAIKTQNNFPHGTGIASSAAGFGALACCLVDLQSTLLGKDFDVQLASSIARLGSGSACRSLFAEPAIWGIHPQIEGSNDDFAIPLQSPVSSNLSGLMDAVLIIDAGEKSVSSTQGHDLLNNNPYSAARYSVATQHLAQICEAFHQGDVNQFIHIVEHEALQLHAMMMLSNPYFILMRPGTLAVIEQVWQFRKETGIPLMFTLDAGANVHLLFPAAHKTAVTNFIEKQLLLYCQNEQYFCTETGKAPTKLV